MSTIFAEHHVLASSHGYATVHASSGLSTEEKQALEVLGFGQTDDLEYLGSIRQYPAAFGRRLLSGRYAITRCFPGKSDSAGRQTLLFATLVIGEGDWLNFVSKGLGDLIADESIWHQVDKSSERIKITVRLKDQVSADLRDVTITIVDAVLVSGSDQTSFLEDSELSSQAVLLSVGILPDDLRARVAWGLRVLSNGFRFDVCSASRFADLGGRRRAVQIRRTADLQSKYASAVRHFWSVSGKIPYALSSASGTSFSDDSGASPNQRKNSFRGGSPLILIGSVTMLVLSVGAIYLFAIPGPSKQSQNVASSSGSDAPQEKSFEPDQPLISQWTPNETEAALLLNEFEQAGQWSLDELRSWSLRARNIFHADTVQGFPEAVEESRTTLMWAEQAHSVAVNLESYVSMVESQHGPFIWLGRTSDLLQHEESLRATSPVRIDEVFHRLHQDILLKPLATIREIVESIDAMERVLVNRDHQQGSTVPEQPNQRSEEEPALPQDPEMPDSEVIQVVPIELVQQMLRSKDGKSLTMKQLSEWWARLSVRDIGDQQLYFNWVLGATQLRIDYLDANRDSIDSNFIREESLILLNELTADRLGFGTKTAHARRIEAMRLVAQSLHDIEEEEPGDE